MIARSSFVTVKNDDFSIDTVMIKFNLERMNTMKKHMFKLISALITCGLVLNLAACTQSPPLLPSEQLSENLVLSDLVSDSTKFKSHYKNVTAVEAQATGKTSTKKGFRENLILHTLVFKVTTADGKSLYSQISTHRDVRQLHVVRSTEDASRWIVKTDGREYKQPVKMAKFDFLYVLFDGVDEALPKPEAKADYKHPGWAEAEQAVASKNAERLKTSIQPLNAIKE